MNMSAKDKSIAAIILEKVKPQEKIVNNLEADFEDAKNGVFEEFLNAIEKKDIQSLKSSFKAIMDMCAEEDQYEDTTEEVEA